MDRCTASARIYSGRPDPVWDVDEDNARDLESLWVSLQAHSGDLPVAPGLGYRGCKLCCGPGLEYVAYGGVVVRQEGPNPEFREDEGRGFERRLLATAPEGLLPVDLSLVAGLLAPP
jgi:hypothetical protein